MVNEDDLVKVLDFGLAKLTEMEPLGEDTATRTRMAESGPHTEEGTILGTVSYMSPEQTEGRKVDARSDVFSFGSVLYEMVTGQQAFLGDSKMSTLAAIINQVPKPVDEAGEGAPGELQRIINLCLSKKLDRRFQHMGDVRILLEQLDEKADSEKRAVHGRPGRRLPVAPAVLAAVALVAVTAGVVRWLVPSDDATGTDSSPPLVRITSDPGLSFTPAISPDG
ncbi:MAG: protein kinase, partial [bacterium]|nr:protein kinase [bacterium]